MSTKLSREIQIKSLQHIAISMLVFVCLAGAQEGRAQVVTIPQPLNEHITEAMTNSPELSAWRDRSEASSHLIPQAGAWPDPTVKLSLMNLPTNSFSFSQEPMTAAWITAGQTIPLAGKPALRTEIAGYNLETTNAGSRGGELKVAESLARIWYDWAYLHEALQTLDTNIDLLDNLIVIALSKYETGKGLQQDILRAETRRTRLEDNRVRLTQMILTTGRRFAVVMGRDPENAPVPPEDLPETFTQLDIYELTESMFNENPSWQGMNAQVAAAGSKLELARRMWWPNLVVGAAYGYRQNADNGMERPDFFTATAGVSLPLYGKRKQGAAVQEKRALQRATVSKRQSMELELRFRLNKLLDEDSRLEEQVRLYIEGVEPQAEATLAASTASYSVGKADFEALLMAETALYNSRLERLARVRDRLQVRASLAALTGGDGLIPEREGR